MDDEMKARFDRMETRIENIVRRLGEHETGVYGRLDAISKRLDEQDAVLDALAGKIDRQAIMVTTAMQSAEQALTSLMALSRRVARLEG